MTKQEQQNAFKMDIEKVIARYAEEFDLTTADAIGVLHMLIFDLLKNCDSRCQAGEE